VEWFKQSVKRFVWYVECFIACGMVQAECEKTCMVCRIFVWRVECLKHNVKRFVWYVESLYGVWNGSNRECKGFCCVWNNSNRVCKGLNDVWNGLVTYRM
jgi:hypothetical protein